MKKKVKKVARSRSSKRASSLKTEKGKVSRGIIFAGVAVVLALGVGAFFFMNMGGSSPLAGVVKAPLNPNCELNDPEICKFFNNYANAPTSFTVTSTGEYGGMSTESVYTMDGSDKYQMIAKQDGKETSNMISIGDTMYTLDYTDNKWWKMTSQPVETMEEDKAEEMSFNPQDNTDNTKYTFVAKEDCGNRTCFKYEVVTPDAEGMKMYIWFDDKEYLMRKMRMEDGKGMYSESVYSYDNVSVKEPSPVKEGDPYSAGSAGSIPSNEEVQKMMQYQQSAESGEAPSYDSEAPIEDISTDGM